jgi:hypothetical protein
MSHIVTITQAMQNLEYKDTSIFYDKRSSLRKFVIKREKQFDLFDMKAYMDEEEHKTSMIEKVKLFVEYLKHIENMSSKDIATISTVTPTLVNRLDFGYKTAKKIVKQFAQYRPFHLKRFDEYYGWKHKPNNRRINFKG